MKRISKSAGEPTELSAYRLRLSSQPSPPTWNQFKSNSNRTRPVKDALRTDQRGLCAYCEIRLAPGNESVEHIIRRDADHERELDWQNLLLVCLGDEKTPPPKELSCGHARNAAGSSDVLNPLQIPADERLFIVESRTGHLHPDVDSCARSGISAELVQASIVNLGLSVSRLARTRVRLLETLEEGVAALVDSGLSFQEAESQLACEQFRPDSDWPEFFTTLRWKLGTAAEERLKKISYNG